MVEDREQIGIVLHGKSLSVSERELVGAGVLIDTKNLPVTLFGKKNSKAKSTAKQEGLTFVRLGKKITKLKDFNAALRLSETLKVEGITTILFRDPRNSGLLVTTKFLMKGKLKLIFMQDRPIREMARDFLLTFQFNQIDAWITPLIQTAKNVKTTTNLDHSKVHVFPLPIPRKPYLRIGGALRRSDRKEKQRITIGYHLPEDEALSGRSARRISACMGHCENMVLIVNSRSSSAVNWVNRNNLMTPFADRVKYTTYRADHPDFYRKIDACFIDPENEPFEGIAVRCLFSGVMPVAPKSMITDELFANGKLAVTYDVNHAHPEFTSNLIAILEDPEALSNWHESAMKTLGKRYTKKQFKQNIRALVRALPRQSLIR
jgi:hypothetical protein